MSPTKKASQALAELSPNTTSPSKASSESDQKEKSQKTALDKMPATAAFPIHNDHTSTYISPSDSMMSPTSKKLSEIKGRRLAGAKSKQLNGRELFAKVRAQNEKNSGAISPMSLSQTDSQESASQSFSDSS
jgi:hypothetical protein